MTFLKCPSCGLRFPDEEGECPDCGWSPADPQVVQPPEEPPPAHGMRQYAGRVVRVEGE